MQTVDPASGQIRRLTASSLWLNSTSGKPPLRVGLLLDSWTLPRFAVSILDDIQASNFVRVELVVLKESATPKPPVSSPQFLRFARRLTNSDLRRHLMYDLYLRYDRRSKAPDHPLDPVDCEARLAGVENISVAPIGKKFVHRFPPEAIEKLRSKKLDVLLRFGFGILKGEILSAARYGVWSYHHGDNDFYRGGPPHFWELWEESPLSGAILQVLTEELDAGVVLCKSLFATHKTLSVSKNRVVPYWGTADLVIRKLHELHELGWEQVTAKAVPSGPYQGKRKLYRTPTNGDMLRWLGPVILKKAVRYPFRRKTVLRWKLAIRQNAVAMIDSTSANPLAGFQWIEPPRGHFWADPFLLEEGGKRWVFFEDYSYQDARAGIACAEVLPDGGLQAPTPCLTHPKHHYSYPYLIRDGDDIFLIPESYDDDAIDLYRCVHFPDQWEHHRTLLRGRFVDTSIWQHEGLWWMLTTIADPHPRATRLLLFYSESLAGTWKFHPANSISTDVRDNRGAGRIFFRNRRWIRPSQSASPVYGYSFSFHEISELTPERYAERLLKTVAPGPGFCGVHTYSCIPGLEFIDGAVMEPREDVLGHD